MMRLRQVVWAAADLDGAEADISGLTGLDVCYRDPGVAAFGLRNGLFVVGDQFLEVVSPTKDDTAAGRFMQRRGGDGGYMVILQTDDLAAVEARATANDIRIVWEGSHEGTSGRHMHPADVGGTILSIDQCDYPAEWAWGGPIWRDFVDTSVVSAVAGVEIAVANPEEVAAKWSALVGVPVNNGAIRLDDAEIRFVASDGTVPDGVVGYDLVATDRTRAGETHDLRNVAIRFV